MAVRPRNSSSATTTSSARVVTIHRGMVQDQGQTVIGNRCLLMAYVHVGHDCVLGDDVIMANNAAVSGHCRVGDFANFGGYAGVPQYRNVGAYSHIAGMSLVLKDVPAYMTVMGNPASAIGLNVEGMRRRGYSKELIRRAETGAPDGLSARPDGQGSLRSALENRPANIRKLRSFWPPSRIPGGASSVPVGRSDSSD